MFDYAKLRGRIVEKYGTLNDFAKKIGVTNNTITWRFKHGFSQADIIVYCDALDIPVADIPSYFFVPKC